MAKYIKFNLTDGEDLSIEINDIESVSYIDANTTQIDLNNGISKFTITHGSALQATAVVEAVYAAMMAPTIGVYSVVKGPISVAQIVDSSSGRQLITTKEKNVTFTSYVFETVPAIEERFIISVKTDNSGSSADNQFTLPWVGTYDVDWGDGNQEIGVTNTQTHTYASAGTYDVAVTATTGKIFFSGAGDALKLLDIKNWGTCEWTGMGSAFRGCTSLTSVTATDAPNLSNVTDISNMFWKCRLSNADFSNWDVSNITNTSLMFSSSGANGTINLSNWDVSNVTNMYAMFYDCTTLQITGIENWNTNSLVNIQQMFKSTSLLDVSFANWNINSITNLSSFLSGNVGTQPVLSTANYDATLISWAAQTPQQNRNVSFGGSQYTLGGAAEAARQTLINTYGWTITDGGGV